MIKKGVRKPVAFVLAFVLAFALIAAVFHSPSVEVFSAPQITSRNAFLMDYQTGEEIWGQYSDAPLVPSSMTKVMAVYMVYDAIEAGELSKNDVVPISEDVAILSLNPVYSNVPLSQEEVYTVDELLSAVICCSACAATLALAEMVGGSEESFVARMNKKAAELGLDAQYYDCFGDSTQNYITPRSMAMLGCCMLSNHPDYLTYSAQSSIFFHGVKYDATNLLLSNTQSYPGIADGIKTGSSSAAGFCLCASVLKDGKRIIAVIMNAPTNADRYQDCARLISCGFAYIEERSAAGWLYVTPSASNIYLDGRRMEISPYLINDNNYFKLRDLAWLLNGTDAAFQVAYSQENGGVYITTGQSYTPVGGEGKPLGSFQAWALPNKPNTYLNGERTYLTSYLINDSNYVKLQDVGALLGFEVDWDAENHCVLINTGNTGNTNGAGAP